MTLSELIEQCGSKEKLLSSILEKLKIENNKGLTIEVEVKQQQSFFGSFLGIFKSNSQLPEIITISGETSDVINDIKDLLKGQIYFEGENNSVVINLFNLEKLLDKDTVIKLNKKKRKTPDVAVTEIADTKKSKTEEDSVKTENTSTGSTYQDLMITNIYPSNFNALENLENQTENHVEVIKQTNSNTDVNISTEEKPKLEECDPILSSVVEFNAATKGEYQTETDEIISAYYQEDLAKTAKLNRFENLISKLEDDQKSLNIILKENISDNDLFAAIAKNESIEKVLVTFKGVANKLEEEIQSFKLS